MRPCPKCGILMEEHELPPDDQATYGAAAILICVAGCEPSLAEWLREWKRRTEAGPDSDSN